jgi:hypothetical protein
MLPASDNPRTPASIHVRLVGGGLGVGDENDPPVAAVLGLELVHDVCHRSGTGEEVEDGRVLVVMSDV